MLRSHRTNELVRLNAYPGLAGASTTPMVTAPATPCCRPSHDSRRGRFAAPSWWRAGGGEEFLVSIPQTTMATAVPALQRLASEIRDAKVFDFGSALQITMSMRVAGRSAGETFAELIERTDAAPYRARAMAGTASSVPRNPREPGRFLIRAPLSNLLKHRRVQKTPDGSGSVDPHWQGLVRILGAANACGSPTRHESVAVPFAYVNVFNTSQSGPGAVTKGS